MKLHGHDSLDSFIDKALSAVKFLDDLGVSRATQELGFRECIAKHALTVKPEDRPLYFDLCNVVLENALKED